MLSVCARYVAPRLDVLVRHMTIKYRPKLRVVMNDDQEVSLAKIHQKREAAWDVSIVTLLSDVSHCVSSLSTGWRRMPDLV